MAYNTLFTSTDLSTNSVFLSNVKFLKQHTQFKGLVQHLSKPTLKCYYARLNLVEEVRTEFRDIETPEDMKQEPKRKESM